VDQPAGRRPRDLGILGRQRKRVFAFELWLHEVPHGASNWGNWDKHFNVAKMSQVLDTSHEAKRITMA
jgi:hypothetical protein